MKYICVHAHFYQPDRRHPNANTLPIEPGAKPFANWNDRIFAECYGVNACSKRGDETYNNYASISSDFGPTLLHWLMNERPLTYDAILQSGAQNKLCQAYHHTILPLANDRDLRTEIIWGIRDFKKRFGRVPSGFWLPELAVNEKVLECLAAEKIDFVVLAPQQAEHLISPEGTVHPSAEFSDGELSSRAYQVDTPAGPLTVFFYHAALAHRVAFGGGLHNGEALAQNILQSLQTIPENGLIHFATDGESYGHHHRFGDLALNELIAQIKNTEDVTLVSYETYLAKHPPQWHAKVRENSAWSCAHGIGRWENNCGCATGNNPSWQQNWRGPLRKVFDWLRDELKAPFERAAKEYFNDPWAARDDYESVMHTSVIAEQRKFFAAQGHPESLSRQYMHKALELLKMQRYLLNMYTSCGWFFDDVNGLESLQNIRRAQAAASIACEQLNVDLLPRLRELLESIPANQAEEYTDSLNDIFGPRQGLQVARSEREAGVLLHISSLPGAHGIGDLGMEARNFVDWLSQTGTRVWQILPLGPTQEDGALYSSWSSLSGNPWLIDLVELQNAGLLTEEEILAARTPSHEPVDFSNVKMRKGPLLRLAATRLLEQVKHPWTEAWLEFRARAEWAGDAGMFHYLKNKFDGKPWWEWPSLERGANRKNLAHHRVEGTSEISNWMVQEFFFERQWRKLRQYCESRSVKILGDLPMYVAEDSVDVWLEQHLFCLSKAGRATHVAGAPPDAFNALGQRWGNPLYDWESMGKTKFSFWKSRFSRGLKHADILRLDHFRAMAAYWQIPAEEPTAVTGKWVAGPGRKLFDSVKRKLGQVPLIVEDLGDIDASVGDLRDELGLPGMTVLQFGFDESGSNEHTPCHHIPHSVVYTGTHDCSTVRGWWANLPESSRDRFRKYSSSDGEDIAWDAIRMAMASVANLAIVPMQDILGLADDARMNVPGTSRNNWTWRLPTGALQEADGGRFREMLELFGRLGPR